MERIFYHLVLVVGRWLVKMLKIVEKLSELYSSATILFHVATHQVLFKKRTIQQNLHCYSP